MSIYHCNECQGQFDSDFVGFNFDPRSEHDLICDDCDICVNYELEAKQEGVSREPRIMA